MGTFDIPVVLIIIALLGFIGTLTLITIAVGSIFILVNNWHKEGTNQRLTKLEKGQARFETELKEIKANQARFETEVIAQFDKILDRLPKKD